MIKKLLDKIKNNQPQSKDAENTLLNKNYILITCEAEQNYEPYIKLHIVDLSDESCEKFTEALFNLNSGQYHQSFINLMLDMSNQDVNIRKFMQSSMMYWGYLIKKLGLNANSDNSTNSDNNKPLISPTDFNKNVKQ